MKQPTQQRSFWLDYLRAFITLLVIAHHAALAYTSFASFNAVAYILSTHPVVDSRRWPVLDVFVSFNDVFFMPLMFLISGMFVIPALRRKGASSFFTDRLFRLFIPFLIAVTLLMWIAYYPAYLLSGKTGGIYNYLLDFFTVEAWPVGPPWFIWVLFLFNAGIALLYKPTSFLFNKASGYVRTLGAKPVTAFLILFVITGLLYVPLAIIFGPNSWTGIGPFDFQKSRMLLYFGYFLIGSIIGVTDFDQGLFSRESPLVKSWKNWVLLAIICFLLLMFIRPEGAFLSGGAFALSAVLSNIAFLTAFRANVQEKSNIWQSLSANAYGMYLTHYIFIVWCQYVLLRLDCPAGIKFLITFIFSACASWLLTRLLRKVSVIKHFI